MSSYLSIHQATPRLSPIYIGIDIGPFPCIVWDDPTTYSLKPWLKAPTESMIRKQLFDKAEALAARNISKAVIMGGHHQSDSDRRWHWTVQLYTDSRQYFDTWHIHVPEAALGTFLRQSLAVSSTPQQAV